MSDAETDQMLANIRSADDLEDFMVYYEFTESEKAEARREWQEKQVQDRGIGTFLLAGVGAFCGYQVLKRLTAKNKLKPGKKPWTPGAGGTKPSWAPAAIGAGLGGLGGYAAGQHFGGHPQQQAPPQQGYGAPPPQGAYNYPPQQFNQPHRDAPQAQQQFAPPQTQYASSFVPPGQQYAPPSQPFAPPSQPYGQPPQQYGQPQPYYPPQQQQPFAPPGGAYFGAPQPQPFAPGPYAQGGPPNAFAPMGGSMR